MKKEKPMKIAAIFLTVLLFFAMPTFAACTSKNAIQMPTGHRTENSNHAASLHALPLSSAEAPVHYAADLDGARDGRTVSESASERRTPMLMAMLALLWLALLIFMLHTWTIVSTTPLACKKRPLLALSIGGNSPPALHA